MVSSGLWSIAVLHELHFCVPLCKRGAGPCIRASRAYGPTGRQAWVRWNTQKKDAFMPQDGRILYFTKYSYAISVLYMARESNVCLLARKRCRQYRRTQGYSQPGYSRLQQLKVASWYSGHGERLLKLETTAEVVSSSRPKGTTFGKAGCTPAPLSSHPTPISPVYGDKQIGPVTEKVGGAGQPGPMVGGTSDKQKQGEREKQKKRRGCQKEGEKERKTQKERKRKKRNPEDKHKSIRFLRRTATESTRDKVLNK